MASKLILSGGGESIDFIAGTEFLLREDGLDLPSPDPVRIEAGAAPFREGQGTVSRKFNNREIVLRFRSENQTHDELRNALAKMQRILNYAVRSQAAQGLMDPATLELKQENQTTSVLFDILDGQINLGGPLNVLTKRQGMLLSSELVLIALPYARGTVIRLDNHLVNPGFTHNGVENARDGGYYVTFGVAGTRFQRTDLTGFRTTGLFDLTFHTVCYPTALTGSEQVIAHCSDSWKLTYTPDDQRFRFTLKDGNSATATVATVKQFPRNAWYAVTAVALSVEGDSNIQTVAIFVNGELAGTTTHELGNVSQTAGEFSLGADQTDTLHFAGRICSAAVILKGIWPWQAKLLYRYGLRSFIRGTEGTLEGTPPGYDYWDWSDDDYGAVWMFDQTSGNATDSGPYARTLTLVGSPVYSYNIRQAGGWTLTGVMSLTNYISLAKTNRKYGAFSLALVKVSGSIFVYQDVVIPTNKRGAAANRDWELVLWGMVTSGSFSVTVSGDVSGTLFAGSITSASLAQRGVNFEHGADDTILTVLIGPANNSNVALACPMLIPGNQFGLGATFAAPVQEIPFITSRYGSAVESGGMDRQVGVYGLPGDGPVATRVFIENP